MKLAARILIASSVLISSVALAQTAPDVSKTRAQVRAELIAAERAGQIPTADADYPPSADTIHHNQELYQASQRFEQKHPHFAFNGAPSNAD
ncbi:MAG TPA: DUF4148 domain-containing protein [Pararobbsia sp.]|nr:DUF4148 domain-containing protein [Pararobbsia sp.]